MSRKSMFFAVGALSLVAGGAASAQTATQSVTYQVQAIQVVSVSGDPGALIISTAVPGSAPTQVSDATTTYAVTTNLTGSKITGSLNTAMPAGVSLGVTLAAPTGATSVGAVVLTAVDQDLVTGITTLAESAKTITYTLDATVTAGVIASASKTVTLTVTGGV
jgi:hypothetical protein